MRTQAALLPTKGPCACLCVCVSVCLCVCARALFSTGTYSTAPTVRACLDCAYVRARVCAYVCVCVNAHSHVTST